MTADSELSLFCRAQKASQISSTSLPNLDPTKSNISFPCLACRNYSFLLDNISNKTAHGTIALSHHCPVSVVEVSHAVSTSSKWVWGSRRKCRVSTCETRCRLDQRAHYGKHPLNKAARVTTWRLCLPNRKGQAAFPAGCSCWLEWGSTCFSFLMLWHRPIYKSDCLSTTLPTSTL